MFTFDNDLKSLVESSVAVVLGTTDAERRPHVTYAWGPRILEDRHRVQVFLEVPRADPVISNLESTGVIAMTVADPISYRSVQFKGRHRETVPAADEADLAWVQRHREGFTSATALIGDPREAIRHAWMEAPLVRIEFEVDGAFDQTPGPDAGRPL